jgi:LysW-gamma-L-alpha-aminoadipyl-6-phosphate/LysW-L-glutamyl-5-phosphate reductase
MGSTGYAGAEMIRRLLRHPHVELSRVVSIDHVGEPLGAVHPNLDGQSELRFENLSAAEAAKDMDIVLLGLPTAVSLEKIPTILEAGAKVVDLSGAYRMRSAETFASAYGLTHPNPSWLTTRFAYGLPELNREAIVATDAVAAPGCFATCIQLGVAPLARSGWLSHPIETVAMTGSSGSGVVPQAGTHHPVRAQNLRTYKTLTHPHSPEVQEQLVRLGAPSSLQVHFVPISAPLVRGILATSFTYISAEISEEQIQASYAELYANQPFVRMPTGRLPEVVAVAGSNYAEVGYTLGPIADGKRLITCFSALDNLVKGGAGQVIQNMNLLLGLEEGESLQDPGGFP